MAGCFLRLGAAQLLIMLTWSGAAIKPNDQAFDLQLERGEVRAWPRRELGALLGLAARLRLDRRGILLRGLAGPLLVYVDRL